MAYLAAALQQQDYVTYCPDLATTWGSLAKCSEQLSDFIDALDLSTHTLHLVGHSMGGLIIRRCLADRTIANLLRCVFIATPNSGSQLADIAVRVTPRFLFKPLQSLHSQAIPISKPLNSPPPEIGVIAGNHSNLLLGKLLASDNDGRVELRSALLTGVKDYVIVPFGHHDIHHRHETAALVGRFLREGRFDT